MVFLIPLCPYTPIPHTSIPQYPSLSRWVVANSRILGEATGAACAIVTLARGGLTLRRAPVRLAVWLLFGMAGGNLGARLACSSAEVSAARPREPRVAATEEASEKPPSEGRRAPRGPTGERAPPKTTITAF